MRERGEAGQGWRMGAKASEVHAPVRAFRNPEYRRRRIHIYAASPGDNSAIMRRARAGRHAAFVALSFPLCVFLRLSLSLFLSPLSGFSVFSRRTHIIVSLVVFVSV